MHQQKNNNNKRKYARLKSVFPVNFRCKGDHPDSQEQRWLQGYTMNIAEGGICLETSYLDEAMYQQLSQKKTSLELMIQIPLKQKPVYAVADVAWTKSTSQTDPRKFYIGLKYSVIDVKDNKKIIKHVKFHRYSSRSFIFLSAILLALFSVAGFLNYKLRVENEKMIKNLVDIQEREIQANDLLIDVVKKRKDIFRQIKKVQEHIETSQKELSNSDDKKDDLQQVIDDVIDEHVQETENLQGQIGDLITRQKPLENEYGYLIRRERQIADNLSMIEKEKKGLQMDVLNKMVQWLLNHQSPTTGLVVSFEGDVGVVKDWAFIYDQSLAANVFLHEGDVSSTKRVLNFFMKNLDDNFNGFHNAYYFDSGQVAEYTVHCGPNIWVGIAVMQYTKKTGDGAYLKIARKIADWLMVIQDKDPAGGIKGGPQFHWFATEHNLDAYAFFKMMYEITKEEKYQKAYLKTFSWLKTYAMIPHGKDYKTPPIKRGRGDATIATDTFAWSLAAIGPEELQSVGMDPEEIMRFAQEHCEVEVVYNRPSGISVNVKGFDFAKHAHMPRGGVVSPEWTSQMVVSYQVLGDHFAKKRDNIKANFYHEKAKAYLNEINKLIISSPSAKGQGEGCLPYATLTNADTGHGWNTPSGVDTCSIAGTAYMIMAIKHFNPLKFD